MNHYGNSKEYDPKEYYWFRQWCYSHAIKILEEYKKENK